MSLTLIESQNKLSRNGSLGSILNTSSSKALFTFSKDERFKQEKSPVSIHAYDMRSNFQQERKDGIQSPFGSTIKSRFDYLGIKKNGQLPPSTRYKIKGSFGDNK
jgi:hypothetical protein